MAAFHMAIVFVAFLVPEAQMERQIGVVAQIDGERHELTLTLDTGESRRVVAAPGAVAVRVPPGERTLERAVPIAFGQIAPGDRIMARGTSNGQVLVADHLVLMRASDLALKKEAENRSGSGAASPAKCLQSMQARAK